MSGPTQVTNITQIKGPVQQGVTKALESYNKEVRNSNKEIAEANANAFKTANDQLITTWKSIEQVKSNKIIQGITVGLAGIQQKALKEQLDNQKQIEKQKDDLIKEEQKLVQSTIDEARKVYLDNYAPVENAYSKLLNDDIEKAVKPNYDAVSKFFNDTLNIRKDKFKISNEKLYTVNGINYINSKISRMNSLTIADGQNKGFLAENLRKIKSDNNSYGRLERWSAQAGNAKNAKKSNIVMFNSAINQLQPNVGGALNSYLGGLGNLAGSIVNLFNSGPSF